MRHPHTQNTCTAPRFVAYPYVNDFARWGSWSPWHALDPNQKITMSPVTAGQGATYEWQGNSDVGKGRMSLRESVQDQKVVEDLAFLEPFESNSVVTFTFTFTAQGAATQLTWAMDTENNFMSKAFGLFMDMDAMIGADFEKGLVKLKPLVEADAVARLEVERVAAETAAAAAATALLDGSTEGVVPNDAVLAPH